MSGEGTGTSFVPGPDMLRPFRDALGRFGTGVTVVTAPGPVGITVNSFASVSLDPPMVLWSVDKGSDRQAEFRAAEFSAIHVLRSDQHAMARAFAVDGRAFDRFDWRPDANGVPLLNDCLVRFECRLVADHDAGDHRILLNAVERTTLHRGDPLIFALGRFGHFDPSV